MKRETQNYLNTLKKSIDWWKNESINVSCEVEEVAHQFESGIISEDEVLLVLENLNNKISYLNKKGLYEQRNLFNYFLDVTPKK